MVELKRKRRRPGIDDRDSGALPPGLPQGRGQHGRFVEGIRPDHDHAVGGFDLPQGNLQVRLQSRHRRLNIGRGRVDVEDRPPPAFGVGEAFEHPLGLQAAPGRTDHGDPLGTGFPGDGFQPFPGDFQGRFPSGFGSVHAGASRSLGKVHIGEAVPPPVADKMAVDRFAEPGFLTDHLPVPGADRDMAPQGAMKTNGGAALEIPPAAPVPGGLVGVNARGADVDEVAGKGTFQGSRLIAAVVDPAADLHDPQIFVAHELLVIANAPVTLDAPVHFVLYQRSQVLVRVGPFRSLIPPDPVPPGDRQILKQTMPPLVADRTVVGVVEHEPLNDVFPEIHRLGVRRGDLHAVLGVDHAAHLNPLEGAVQAVDGADPARAHGPQGRMVAEPRDDDPQPLRRINHLGPIGDGDLLLVDDQFRHGYTLALNGHFFSRMWSRTSSWKSFSKPSSGAAAPGAKAQ